MAVKDMTMLGPWPKGMNNIKPDYALGSDELRQITNFDVTDEGHLRSRKGRTEIYAGSAPVHSLWASKSDTVYFVEGDVLKKLNPDNTATTLKSDCGHSRKMFYVEVGDRIFFSNGQVTGRLKGGVTGSWGLPAPMYSPALASTSGALYGGWYQVLLTYRDSAGRESGSVVLPSRLYVTDNSGIIATLLTTSLPAEATHVRIYCTEANGSEYYLHGEVVVGTSAYLIASSPVGTRLRTRGLVPFPASQLLQVHKGSVVGASGNLLMFSPPYNYELYDTSKGFLQYEDDIQVVAAMDTGMYVATSEATYWQPGDAATGFGEAKLVFPFGGAFGSLYSASENADPVWFSPKGFIVGKEGGNAEALHELTVSVGEVEEAAVVVKEQDGLRQAVAVPVSKPFGSAFSIGDYAEAEVRRVNTEV